ncbi:hypothetical protein [Methylosinus sp. R-45379]|uniref:hypothetical protein n=1 Tax=Methylosinus sp. R-45379 TaxID=980563 RepID=UPI0012EE9731|nr:hypothetical protein [Methylosinus sp. R-45379]
MTRASQLEAEDFGPNEKLPQFGLCAEYFETSPRQEIREQALRLSKSADPLSVWRGLAQHWGSWDFINHDGWKPIFKRARHAWTSDVFSDKQRAMYDALPDNITLFRGSDAKLRNSHRRLSWTLDFEIAAWFARRTNLCGGKGVVYKGLLNKDEIALCFPGREQEVVPFSALVIKDIETVAF